MGQAYTPRVEENQLRRESGLSELTSDEFFFIATENTKTEFLNHYAHLNTAPSSPSTPSSSTSSSLSTSSSVSTVASPIINSFSCPVCGHPS